MTEPLFVAQQKLEEWIEEGSVTFQDNILTLLAHNASYAMVAAVKITLVLDGEDHAGLLGKVWTLDDLQARGAETMYDSVILGETAYQGEPGFVGRPSQQQAQQTAPAAPPLPVTSPESSASVPTANPPNPAASPTSPAPPGPPPLPTRRPTTRSAPPPVPQAQAQPDTSDMDLLTDFMLKNMD